MYRWSAPPEGTDVCAISDVPTGGAIVVAVGTQRTEIIVVRDADGARGFVNICPHTPLPLNIDSRIYSHENEVHCDHHFATFRFSDGLCTAGACPGEALTLVPLAIEGDRLKIAAKTAE
jgi:nitrite reductase/ring-hydroxylating ferredoxin subunit